MCASGGQGYPVIVSQFKKANLGNSNRLTEISEDSTEISCHLSGMFLKIEANEYLQKVNFPGKNQLGHSAKYIDHSK